MKFKGTNRDEVAQSQEQWRAWCRQTRRRPQLREFAERLTLLVEARVNAHTHVAALAAQAIKDADRTGITDAQLREVILLLYRVWAHGLSLCNWAHRKTNLLRPND